MESAWHDPDFHSHLIGDGDREAVHSNWRPLRVFPASGTFGRWLDMEKDFPQLTILTRKACSPCKTALHLARRLQHEMHFTVTETDIDTDPGLTARYGEKIPVILIDGVEACSGIVTEERLRRAIKGARWRKPISRILSRLGLRPKR